MKAFIFPLLLFCSIELNTAAPISIKAYPNPATSFVFCTVQTPEAIDAPLIIYNWKGQEVKTVFGKQTPGVFTYFWSVNDMLSGIYFCRIQVENQIFIKKIIVLHPQ